MIYKHLFIVDCLREKEKRKYLKGKKKIGDINLGIES